MIRRAQRRGRCHPPRSPPTVRAHRSRGGSGASSRRPCRAGDPSSYDGGGRGAGGAPREVLVEPGRLAGSSGPSTRPRRERVRSVVAEGPRSSPLMIAPGQRPAPVSAPVRACGVRVAASASASAARSTASAWRRLSRARVRRARAATWLTPSAAASSRPLRSWSSARRSAARWRSGMRASARCMSPDRLASITRCSAEGAASRDSPDHGMNRMILRAADLVERDAVGDLVQPRPRVLGLLERVVVLVRLDERVLGHVGGDLGVAHHAHEVRVDLVLVRREQRLHEAVGLVVIPGRRSWAAPARRQRAGGAVRSCRGSATTLAPAGRIGSPRSGALRSRPL